MKKVVLFIFVLAAISLIIGARTSIPRDLEEMEYYYGDYPDYYEVVEWIHDMAETYPEICHEESIGVSQELHIPIWALKISDNASVNEDEPAMLLTGSIHAEEIVGTEVCMFLAETLATAYTTEELIRNYVDNAETWLVPVVNPEGYQVIFEELDWTYRKNRRDNDLDGYFDFTFFHGNDSDGVDLNRNFTFNWDGVDSDDDIVATTYRGPSPGSESETQAMMRLCERERFALSVWYHSSASGTLNEKVFYSWGFDSGLLPVETPDQDRNSSLASMIARRLLKSNYFGSYITGPTRKEAGTSIDWEYVNYATFSCIIELDTMTQPPYEFIPNIVRNQFNGHKVMYSMLDESMLVIHVHHCWSDEPLEARVELAKHMDDVLEPRYTDPIYGSHYRIMYPDEDTIIATAPGFDPVRLPITILDGEPTYISFGMCPEGVFEDKELVPDEPSIKPLSPNPFNGAAQITFTLPEDHSSEANIAIYDNMGNKVYEPNMYAVPGINTFTWRPSRRLPSGVYLVKLITDNKEYTQKTMYIK